MSRFATLALALCLARIVLPTAADGAAPHVDPAAEAAAIPATAIPSSLLSQDQHAAAENGVEYDGSTMMFQHFGTSKERRTLSDAERKARVWTLAERLYGPKRLHKAAFDGTPADVALLAAASPAVARSDESRIGRATPAHFAALGGSLEALKFLVDGTDTVQTVDQWGRTMLDFAAWGGDVATLEYVLQHPFNIQRLPVDLPAGTQPADGGGSPLKISLEMHAAFGGSVAMLRRLREGRALNRDDPANVDRGIRSACSYAMWAGFLDAHAAATELGLCELDCTRTDAAERTVCHYAALSGHLDALVPCIEELKCGTWSDLDRQGHHYMHFAAWSGSLPMMKFLMQHWTSMGQPGPSPMTLVNALNQTVCMFSAMSGNVEAMSFCLEHPDVRRMHRAVGWRSMASFVSRTDSSGKDMLALAERFGPPAAAEFLRQFKTSTGIMD